MNELMFEIAYRILEFIRSAGPQTKESITIEILALPVFANVPLTEINVADILDVTLNVGLVKSNDQHHMENFDLTPQGIKLYYINKKERDRLEELQKQRANPVTITLTPADGYEKTYEAFLDRYALINVIIPPEKKQKPAKSGQAKTCRFCGKRFPEVSFTDEAHLIPQLLGNKTLLSDFECDTCNHFFGELFEDDLANYLGISRTLTQTRGKNGIPGFKSPNDAIRAKAEDLLDELSVIISRDDTENQTITTDSEKGEIIIKIKRNPHVPLHVYKAFLKIALSVLPDNEMKNYQQAFRLLMTDEIRPEQGFVMSGYSLPFTFNFTPHIFVFQKRDPEALIHSHVVAVYFGNSIFALPVPFHDEDIRKIKTNPKIQVYPYPPVFTHFTDVTGLPIEPFQDDFSSREVIRDAEQHILLKISKEELDKLSVYDSTTGEMKSARFDPTAIKQIIMRKSQNPIDPKKLFERLTRNENYNMNIDDMPVHMNYSDFSSLNDGINPTSKREVIDHVKAGKKYIVDFDGVPHNIGVDDQDHLILLPSM